MADSALHVVVAQELHLSDHSAYNIRALDLCRANATHERRARRRQFFFPAPPHSLPPPCPLNATSCAQIATTQRASRAATRDRLVTWSPNQSSPL